jgi:hypothetical protein
MPTVTKWIVLAAGAVASAAGSPVAAAPVPAVPQPAEAKPAVVTPLPVLLRNRDVLRELDCTAAQRVAIDDAFDALAADFEAVYAAEKKKQGLAEIDATQIQKAHDLKVLKTAAKLAAAFTPAQTSRLRELDLQIRGVRSFAEPDVAAALKLTDAQKATVADAIDHVRPTFVRPLIAGGEPLDQFDGYEERWAEGLKRVTAALTDEQKATWGRLIGKPSKLTPQALALIDTHDVRIILPPDVPQPGAGNAAPAQPAEKE